VLASMLLFVSIGLMAGAMVLSRRREHRHTSVVRKKS
jgi:hypothetical protein